jgi:Ubiquitin family
MIPESFIEEWRLYVKRSSNSVTPPKNIDTTKILCQHGKLICNIPNSIEKIKFDELPNAIVVNEEEFNCLRNSYPLQGPLIIVSLIGHQQFQYSPLFCPPCQESLRLDYKKAKITIIKKEPLNTEPNTKRRKTLTSKSASKTNLLVQPSTTIHQLKLELMEKFNAPPFYQKLFFKGQECIDEATMSVLGVFAGVELQLEVFEESGKEFQGIIKSILF